MMDKHDSPDQKSLLPRRIGYLTLWTHDLAYDRAVFSEVLRLPERSASRDAVVFDMEGTDFVLQQTSEETRQLAGTMQFGFYVDNPDHIMEALASTDCPIPIAGAPLDDVHRLYGFQLRAGHLVELMARRSADPAASPAPEHAAEEDAE